MFAALTRRVADDAVIAVDVGNNTYSFGRYFECTGQSVLMSGYLGSIGFGFPAAMGAWAAAPDRQIVAVTGDGGFGQYLAELTTAVKYDMNITHVLLDNAQLGKITKEQRAGEFDVWQTSLHNPDFAEYARICGALGIRVDRADQLDPTALPRGAGATRARRWSHVLADGEPASDRVDRQLPLASGAGTGRSAPAQEASRAATGKMSAEARPAATNAAAVAGVIRSRLTPMAVLATMNGSEVACSSPAAAAPVGADRRPVEHRRHARGRRAGRAGRSAPARGSTGWSSSAFRSNSMPLVTKNTGMTKP